MLGRFCRLLCEEPHLFSQFSSKFAWKTQEFDYDGLKMRRVYTDLPSPWEDFRVYGHVHKNEVLPDGPYWHRHGQPTAVIVCPTYGASYRLLTGFRRADGSHACLSDVLLGHGGICDFAYQHTDTEACHAVVSTGIIISAMLVQTKGDFAPWPTPSAADLRRLKSAVVDVMDLVKAHFGEAP